MARKHEPLNFAGSLEVQSQKPLDARRKVTLIADLTDAASFPYIYKGLDVFCEENSKWYTFLGGDSTDASNWRQEGTGGTGGGNAEFDIGTIPLGGSGAYEVNAILSNNDSERVQALYTRGANGELPDWFSMFVNSGLGSDTFHIATKEYADGLMSGKVDYVVLDVANFNMSKDEFVQLFYSDKLIYIKDGYLNHLVTDKYTWDLMPETEYELSYIEGNISYTYQFETSDDIYYRGRTVKPVGYNLAVDDERLIGTYREAGINYNVYSKVIKINALPSAAGTTTYDHGITGIKQILQVYGFCSNGFVMNAPRQSLQDNISVYQVSKTTGNQKISIEVGKDRSSLSAYVCLVYAKNNN